MSPGPTDQTLLDKAIELCQRSNHAVALTGAGMSTPSGIPDFRSSGSGVWEHVDPMEVASFRGFVRRPESFFFWFRELARTILNARPNPAHVALATLEAHGPLKAIITQNIDLLHSKAGSQTVHEVHGHLRSATCLHCGSQEAGEPLLREFLASNRIPNCKVCSGTIKPDVILFGENLPLEIYRMAERAIRRCDLLLAAGSSLAVWPVNDLPRLAKQSGARLIIVNHDPTECDDLADLVVNEDVATFLPQLAAAFI